MLIAGGKCQVGFGRAGSTVTMRLDGHLMHAIAGGALIGTWPCPVPAAKAARLPRTQAAATALPPPLPAGLGPVEIERRQVPPIPAVAVRDTLDLEDAASWFQGALGRVAALTIPAVELAVITHIGPHHDVDRAYGALGSYVAEHAVGIDGPLREFYVVGAHDTAEETQWRTDIG